MGSIVNGLTIIGGGLLERDSPRISAHAKDTVTKVLGLVPSHWAFKWPCRQKKFYCYGHQPLPWRLDR